MESIFSAKLNTRVRPNGILVKVRKSATFEDEILATLGGKIWNALPQNIKAENAENAARLFKACLTFLRHSAIGGKYCNIILMVSF